MQCGQSGGVPCQAETMRAARDARVFERAKTYGTLLVIFNGLRKQALQPNSLRWGDLNGWCSTRGLVLAGDTKLPEIVGRN